MEEALQLIKDVGFPIFVVLWFMFRTETAMKKMNEAMNRLTMAINNLTRLGNGQN